jgi:hypothetical protein
MWHRGGPAIRCTKNPSRRWYDAIATARLLMDGENMNEDLRGYQCYWRRIARHLSLSEAGKQLGLRASQLSTFERGGAHDLDDEQVAAYVAWLESIEVPLPDDEGGENGEVDEDNPSA